MSTKYATVNLTPKARKLIDTFDEAAQRHGWQSDQGSMTGAEKAQEAHSAAKHELEAYIASLQSRLRDCGGRP